MNRGVDSIYFCFLFFSLHFSNLIVEVFGGKKLRTITKI